MRTYLVIGNQRQIGIVHAGQHEFVRSLMHGRTCIVPFRDVDEPTSSLEDDEDDWCHPDEDSGRCQSEYRI
ncbi:hypothetical protein DPMN_067815 [Dreissena polymorpha]|uniref:Uncharacterized protein n=1 Tax=Dreissena polymorpha TaxID=45954 RepID=A0A9D3Z0D6_DREPO|nr:hypothetical protein DPMN_067815 [Dreissena polymorpha]